MNQNKLQGFDLHFSTRVCGVYAITHIATGRQYVGSSVNLYKRVSKHLSELNKNRHHSPILQNAWNKYGAEAFSFSILESSIDPQELTTREQGWLDELAPHYNICKVAQSVLGIKRSIETRRKLSAALTGKAKSAEHVERMRVVGKMCSRPISAENRAALNAALKGVKKSPRTREHVEKIAAACRGRTHSQESKEKMSAAQKGIKRSEEWHAKIKKAARNRSKEHLEKIAAAKSKSYIVTTPEGEEMEIRNMRAFCRDNGLTTSSMAACARGEQSHHKGWRVRFLT